MLEIYFELHKYREKSIEIKTNTNIFRSNKKKKKKKSAPGSESRALRSQRQRVTVKLQNQVIGYWLSLYKKLDMPLWRQHSYDSIFFFFFFFFFLWIENTLITLINLLRHHSLYNKRKQAYTAMAVVYEISDTFAWWNNRVLVEKKKKKKNYKKDLPTHRQQHILVQSTATPAISEPLHIAVLISQFKRYIHTARVWIRVTGGRIISVSTL